MQLMDKLLQWMTSALFSTGEYPPIGLQVIIAAIYIVNIIMATTQHYLLVHGAWHASWCWQKVAAKLMAAGHIVLTPDLPGHGEKLRAANTVTFNDYVSSIIELVQQQPEPVILVGHSMAGLIISQVAENIPDRIRELIYVAAYIPKNMQSLFSIAEISESRNVEPLLSIDRAKKEIRLKYSSELSSIFFNLCEQEDTEYALTRLQPQPLQPFIAPVRLGENFSGVKKRSVICNYDRVLIPNDQLCYSQSVTAEIVYLDADHSPYYSATDDLVNILIKRGSTHAKAIIKRT